jgi:hypothetical protein
MAQQSLSRYEDLKARVEALGCRLLLTEGAAQPGGYCMHIFDPKAPFDTNGNNYGLVIVHGDEREIAGWCERREVAPAWPDILRVNRDAADVDNATPGQRRDEAAVSIETILRVIPLLTGNGDEDQMRAGLHLIESELRRVDEFVMNMELPADSKGGVALAS